MDIPKLNIGAKALSKEIFRILTPEFINQLAVETGFIVRKSTKLDGYKFLDILLFTEFNFKKLSLNDLCVELYKRYKIKVKRQSMDERFSTCATNFFKLVLSNVIKVQISNEVSIELDSFERVLIKDSTSFKLSSNMAEKYPGGSSTKAGVRIQFEYDLRSYMITDLSLHPFNKQDTKNARETIDSVQKGDLLIRDLGYIIIHILKEIAKRGAYYVNRPPSTALIYELKDGKYVEIDFKRLIHNMLHSKTERLDLEVYIGKEELFKTRIVIELLPEKVYQKRLREANAKAKKQGRTLSDAYQTRLRLNLIITNTTIPAEEVRRLYSLRWQIELMFKIWKSVGEIDKVKKMKVERFEVSLFAKLIWIALNWQIMKRIVSGFFLKADIELSPYKIYKTIKSCDKKFREALHSNTNKMEKLIELYIELAPDYLVSEKKKNGVWSYDLLKLFMRLDNH